MKTPNLALRRTKYRTCRPAGDGLDDDISHSNAMTTTDLPRRSQVEMVTSELAELRIPRASCNLALPKLMGQDQ